MDRSVGNGRLPSPLPRSNDLIDDALPRAVAKSAVGVARSANHCVLDAWGYPQLCDPDAIPSVLRGWLDAHLPTDLGANGKMCMIFLDGCEAYSEHLCRWRYVKPSGTTFEGHSLPISRIAGQCTSTRTVRFGAARHCCGR